MTTMTRNNWGCMKKVSEYLQHARECREMKRTFNPESHQQLEEIAKAWEQMAEARRQKLNRGDQLDVALKHLR